MSCVPGTHSGQGSSASKELRAWGERQANRTAGPAPTASPIPLRLSSLQRHSATHSGPLSPGGADGQPQALARAALFRGGVPFPVLHKGSRCLSVRGPQRRDPQHPQTSANQDSAALCARPWPDSLGRRHRVGASAWLRGGPRRCLGAAATRARRHMWLPVAALSRCWGSDIKNSKRCFTAGLPCARRCAEHLTVTISVLTRP